MKPTCFSRRSLLTLATNAGAGALLASLSACAYAQESPIVRRSVPMLLGSSPQALPPLPYARDALEPIISAQTVAFHYGKHHKAYFDNLVALTRNTPFSGRSLEELIMATHGDPSHEAVFNNAAQAWNHNFYWRSLNPSKTMPSRHLLGAIQQDFNSMAALLEKLVSVGASQFGSGWTWLVLDRGRLSVVKTSNAEIPFTLGMVPLLTIDVWEHAYYLQYQNRRLEYLTSVIGNFLNWDFANENYSRT